jgi:hypothetical protein
MSMSIDTEPGEYVKFVGVGGYPMQNKDAHNALVVGDIYAVSYIKVGDWETSVQLRGVVGQFNSVLFENSTESPLEPGWSKAENIIADQLHPGTHGWFAALCAAREIIAALEAGGLNVN